MDGCGCCVGVYGIVSLKKIKGGVTVLGSLICSINSVINLGYSH